MAVVLSAGLFGSLCIFGGTAAAAEKFTDLQHAQWAEDSIQYLSNRGTVAGYGGGRFNPDGAVTRAQAVAFMARELYPQGIPEADAEAAIYSDVSPSHFFYREIAAAASKGLASGFPDGSFRPDAPITRAETAAFLARAYALVAGNQDMRLSDVATSWAADPIRIMSSNGLIGGYADGTYRPDRTVTRAEFAFYDSGDPFRTGGGHSGEGLGQAAVVHDVERAGRADADAGYPHVERAADNNRSRRAEGDHP